MNWESWLRAWAVHSRAIAFARRVDTAKKVILSATSHGRLFCSLSGGKDSVAMAGLLHEAGLAGRVPCVHATSVMSFPDTLSVVDDVAAKLNMDLVVVEPDNLEFHVKRIAKKYGVTPPQPALAGYSEWDLLRAVPANVDITDALDDVWQAVAAGNMMVAFMYAEGYDGSFVGLRADESRGRSWYARAWGTVHRSAKDGTYQVCPLLGWSAMDVYAYLVSRDLPIHPYYQAAYEIAGGATDPGRLRVDLAITPSGIAARGGMALIRRVYPEHFRQLATIRPELRGYA